MGGESLKGASPLRRRRRRLGLYRPLYSSPSPNWAALAQGAEGVFHRGPDFSGILGSAPYSPLSFLPLFLLFSFKLPGRRCWRGLTARP